MEDSRRPTADEVTRSLAADGERLLRIDDASLKPPMPPKPPRSRRMLYLTLVAAVVLLSLAGGACFFTDVLLHGAVAPEEEGPPSQMSGTSGGAPSQGTGTGAHNESAPGHVDQSWTPTYVKAGDWEIALARQQVVTEDYTPAAGNAKDGSTFVMAALYVVNKGSANAELKAECFSAEAGGASFALKGFEPQTARPGNPVAFEAAFEVPRDTQGLSVRFTAPDGTGTATLPLPEVLY